jgi:hypothetical protein
MTEDSILTDLVVSTGKVEFDSSVATAGGSDGGNSLDTGIIPSFFYTRVLNEKSRFGFSAVAPFGGGLDYGENFVGRYDRGAQRGGRGLFGDQGVFPAIRTLVRGCRRARRDSPAHQSSRQSTGGCISLSTAWRSRNRALIFPRVHEFSQRSRTAAALLQYPDEQLYQPHLAAREGEPRPGTVLVETPRQRLRGRVSLRDGKARHVRVVCRTDPAGLREPAGEGARRQRGFFAVDTRMNGLTELLEFGRISGFHEVN